MNTNNRSAALSASFNNKKSLYAAYMDCIADHEASLGHSWGLFIASDERYNLGDSLEIRIEITETYEIYMLIGTVIWITPSGSEGGKLPGVGVKFYDEIVYSKVNEYLAGFSGNQADKYTM